MKKLLVALGFALAATGASANIVSGGLTIENDGVVAMSFSDPGWGAVGSGDRFLAEGSYINGDGKSGILKANGNGIFTATYLGQVASFDNLYFGNPSDLTTQNAGHSNENIFSTTSMSVTDGQVIGFGFKDGNTSNFSINGINGIPAEDSNVGIAFFLNRYHLNDNDGQLFDFLIGYNDSATVNADYDDYVVGVVNHVPVPAALPLMASALGMFGVSRRKSKKAA